jgi:hypothetical protein
MYEIDGVVINRPKTRDEIWNPDEFMIGTKKIRPEAVALLKTLGEFIKISSSTDYEDVTDLEGVSPEEMQEEMQKFEDLVKGALDSDVIAIPERRPFPRSGLYLINSDIVTLFEDVDPSRFQHFLPELKNGASVASKQEDVSEEQICLSCHGPIRSHLFTLWGTFDVNRSSLIDVRWLDLFAVGYLDLPEC